MQHIWHQVNEQLSHDSRHPNHRPRSRAVSEHDPDKADNLTSTANTLKSAAAVERKDKSGWIAQARPPMDVEWTVDRDDLVNITFEFNNCGRESLATWKKVRCFGYESRHPNLNQSSGPTSQMVFSLKTFLNMQSDDFERYCNSLLLCRKYRVDGYPSLLPAFPDAVNPRSSFLWCCALSRLGRPLPGTSSSLRASTASGCHAKPGSR